MAGYDPSSGRIAFRYTNWLERFKYFVIAFWIIVVCGCIYFAPRLIEKTTYTFAPPTDSLAYKGNVALQNAFPQYGDGATDLAIFIFTTDDSTVLRDDVKNFSLALNTSIYSFSSNPSFIQQCMGYYYALALGYTPVAQKYVSENNASTIIALSAGTPYSSMLALDFSKYLANEAEKVWHPQDNRVKYEILGTSAFLPMLQASAEHDFLVVDGVSLPLAMLVLAYILRSMRLMMLPIFCIGTSIVTSFGIMYLVATFLNVVAFTPSLMMSILVAMSFDYSLFLLSRYREVLFIGSNHRQAVETMLSSAGHTITVSGLTLAGTFLGLIILPLEMMKTLGLGSAVAILVTLLVNITLTPAVLLTFNNFFPRCVEPFTCFNRQWTFGARLGDDRTPLINDEKKPKTGFWYKLGRITTKYPWNILIVLVIVGATIPVDLHAIGYKTSDSFTIALPRHYEITKAYNLMCEEFGYGTVFPYVLFMEAPENQTVFSPTFFNYSQTVISQLIARAPNTYPENFNTLTYASGVDVPFDGPISYVACTTNTSFFYSSDICVSLRYAAQTLVNPNQTALLIYITLSWDPMAQGGYEWINAARDVLDDVANSTNCTLYFTGIVSDSMDAIRLIYSAFPIMGAVTVAVVLVFVGISFRSIFVPLRSVLTIMLTLAFVYGLATLTYQYDIFKWLHFEGLIANGSLSWIPPLVSFSIIVGIGLDYDIFLLTRVQEYREDDEYSTQDSIIKGLHKTGGIITAAGIIMAIAFSGLLFSDIGAMNQLSFYLVFSVLFDTFIVRSLLVPSLMGVLRDLNWWPKKMPAPSKGPLIFW